MAEIVQNAAPSGNVGGAWNAFLNILVNYWWVLLLFGLLIGVIIVAFVIWKKKEENDRRRDSAVYATAMNLYEATAHNAKPEWIRNYYSLWNLLWFGIPFKRIEHSVRLVDRDRNVLGFYRGHAYTQDGDLVFLAYKNKIWLGLVEDKFLLYCPMKIRHPVMKQVKTKGKVELEQLKDKNGNPVFNYQELPKNFIIYDTEKGNEIRISCNTITKQGNYYHFPNYVFATENSERHLDLTEHISSTIAKVNYLVQLENAYGDMSRSMGRAVEVNPYLRIKQKEPEKEKQIDEEADAGQ